VPNETLGPNITRRDFIKIGGVVAGVFTMWRCAPKLEQAIPGVNATKEAPTAITETEITFASIKVAAPKEAEATTLKARFKEMIAKVRPSTTEEGKFVAEQVVQNAYGFSVELGANDNGITVAKSNYVGVEGFRVVDQDNNLIETVQAELWVDNHEKGTLAQLIPAVAASGDTYWIEPSTIIDTKVNELAKRREVAKEDKPELAKIMTEYQEFLIGQIEVGRAIVVGMKDGTLGFRPVEWQRELGNWPKLKPDVYAAYKAADLKSLPTPIAPNNEQQASFENIHNVSKQVINKKDVIFVSDMISIGGGAKVKVGDPNSIGNRVVEEIVLPTKMAEDKQKELRDKFDAKAIGFEPGATQWMVNKNNEMILVDTKDPSIVIAKENGVSGEVRVLWEFDVIAGKFFQPDVIRETPDSTEDKKIIAYGEKEREFFVAQLDKLVKIGVWDGVESFQDESGGTRETGYNKNLYILYFKIHERGFITYLNPKNSKGLPGVGFEDVVAEVIEIAPESWVKFCTHGN